MLLLRMESLELIRTLTLSAPARFRFQQAIKELAAEVTKRKEAPEILSARLWPTKMISLAAVRSVGQSTTPAKVLFPTERTDLLVAMLAAPCTVLDRASDLDVVKTEPVATLRSSMTTSSKVERMSPVRKKEKLILLFGEY